MLPLNGKDRGELKATVTCRLDAVVCLLLSPREPCAVSFTFSSRDLTEHQSLAASTPILLEPLLHDPTLPIIALEILSYGAACTLSPVPPIPGLIA